MLPMWTVSSEIWLVLLIIFLNIARDDFGLEVVLPDSVTHSFHSLEAVKEVVLDNILTTKLCSWNTSCFGELSQTCDSYKEEIETVF